MFISFVQHSIALHSQERGDWAISFRLEWDVDVSEEMESHLGLLNILCMGRMG
jgi:hypothetical protein